MVMLLMNIIIDIIIISVDINLVIVFIVTMMNIILIIVDVIIAIIGSMVMVGKGDGSFGSLGAPTQCGRIQICSLGSWIIEIGVEDVK